MRVQVFQLRLSASASGSDLHRRPPPPNNSFKPTPCRGVGRVLCATLAHVCRPATGRLNSGVRRQKSVWWFYCSSLRVFRLRSVLLFGQILSAFRFGYIAWRAQTSHTVRLPASVTVIRFRSVRRLQMRSLRRRPGRVRGARSGLPASVSASPPWLHLRRVPSRLTSRSSRPRVVASATCFTLRLHVSAAPPQGGLTPALGPLWLSSLSLQNIKASRLLAK